MEDKTYILKNGIIVKSIPIGKANIHIGDKNNRLTICDRGPNNKSKKARVICRCDCGKYTLINHQDFKEGKVKSCGCLSLELKKERYKTTLNNTVDFSSKERNINPFYEYIKPTEQRKHSQVVWEIECRQCGKHYFNVPNELISEKRTHGSNPCLCWKKFSVGVQKIINLLDKNNIKYEMEKTFNTCISPLGYKLPFDFFLPDYNIIIEYDGEQHFKPAFGEDKNKLIKQQQYDKIKNSWCKENNIIINRIPYYKTKIKLQDLIKKGEF